MGSLPHASLSNDVSPTCGHPLHLADDPDIVPTELSRLALLPDEGKHFDDEAIAGCFADPEDTFLGLTPGERLRTRGRAWGASSSSPKARARRSVSCTRCDHFCDMFVVLLLLVASHRGDAAYQEP